MHGTFAMKRTTDTRLVPACFPSGERWYVVRTNIRCESRAHMGLSAAGFRSFLPEITKWMNHARVKTVGRVALFPRYLFVEADFNKQSISLIHETHGVESIINNNGVPSSIYGDFITRLIERQLQGDFDLTRNEPLPRMAKVKIMEGRYEDCEAVIANLPGKKRAELLISIMGRKVRDTLALANLRPAW